MSSNRPLRVLIADDEPLARRHLVQSLEKIENVKICAQCSSGQEALEAVHSVQPDVLLLDIKMPNMTGFDLIKNLSPDYAQRVIFVTAFDQYALKAFELNALDYLLKPVTLKRLKESLSRYKDGSFVKRAKGYRQRLLASLESLPAHEDKTTIKVHDGQQHLMLEADLIDYVEAAGNYICIYYGDEVHVIRRTLKSLARELDESVFVRVHRSTIINTRKIRSIRPHINGEYLLTMGGGKRVKVSRTYRESIASLL
ncbi:MAG TPA: LytTR family DNA-binding domain-containing protein [Wenzhouxiangella sp.]|nr:LytTR family DNA-binding domain-containing protein [Wenzhouxiangella sp.]